FSPRLAGTYALTPRSYLRASLGTAYRAPNFLELFVPAYLLNQQPPFPVPPIPVLITGNPRLKPEDTTAGEIGIRVAMAHETTLDAAAFSNHVGNLITFVTFFPPPAPGTAPGGTWKNTGSETIRGAEITLSRRLSLNLRTSLQYVYLDAGRLNLNTPNAVGLAGVAPHHSVSWQTYAEHIRGMTASFILNARSSSQATGSSVIADATIGRKVRPWLGLQLIAHNLLNGNYAVGQNIPGAGRTVYLRISGSFE
ncbi:MAG: TonB-dependent receptor, partial [Chloroflexi bacterium]|nr:TonB-dependent receptor [Chloroflexota bacterium]